MRVYLNIHIGTYIIMNNDNVIVHYVLITIPKCFNLTFVLFLLVNKNLIKQLFDVINKNN